MKTKALLAALCAAALNTLAWDSSENKIWLDGSIKGALTEKLSVKLGEQLRYNDEGRFNYYRHTELGAQWAFSKAWSVSAAYRHIMMRKSADADWVEKPMPHATVKNRLQLSFVELRSRLRVTYLALEGQRDLTHFRPKFALMPSTDWKLKPYASFEGIYNFEYGYLFRTRTGGGLLYAPFKKLSLNLFAAQERTCTVPSADWNECWLAGLQARFNF